ncbi:6-phosphogluconolactonase [Corynebacterium sp. MSK039]|uniref:6-phosphogluconolactonase n=1 Tax=Corynebacterium sp. MSK039 TaxID=3050193 RepID=UPI00254AB474|nr:6-phosphogluconolactonase [Corynebacterium sp. MSK039]MDK8790226.1 6-phosphogluconolactonase [Corynebacterium sp. MSK039]
MTAEHRGEHGTIDGTVSEGGVTVVQNVDQRGLAAAAAREVVRTVTKIQREQSGVHGDGVARIVLTGGGAGIQTLRELAVLDHAATTAAEDFPIDAIDWSRVLIFFGDERFVPAGDSERNEKQARDALLDHIAIPAENIVSYLAPTGAGPSDGAELDEAARDYEEKLARLAPQGFDVHLLGMGPEGHINSLFPHTPELLEATGEVVAVRDCPKPPPERVSLTISAVNRAAQVWLLVSGAEKAEAAEQVANGGNGAQWPGAIVAGVERTVLWVDEAASPWLAESASDSATVAATEDAENAEN